ncbi:SufE family protein [Stappia indica]|uniref:SufE family protein n=1 Tax=Stappia indica TaxID=538381 RepID=UPI001CD6BECF|nr:SufE family protein [Stappia indica]MCA1299581.1 SufE family protein [Stappia indica]
MPHAKRDPQNQTGAQAPPPPVDAVLAELRGALAAEGDWGEAVRALLDLEAGLVALPPERCCDETRFHGCQSQVWLELARDPADGRISVRAMSDARMMRGLLAVATRLYHRRTPAEIVALPPSRLEELGIGGFLAPSRANGFRRILEHIRHFAEACERQEANG